MAYQVAVLLGVVTVACAQLVQRVPLSGVQYGLAPAAGYHALAPARYSAAPGRVAENYDANPQYEYSYSVEDPTTGDAKSASESRSGDTVQGSYSLVEPDGTRRTVEYTVDQASGFNAVVRKEGVASGLAQAPVRHAYSPARLAFAHAPLPYAHAPIAQYQESPAVYRNTFSSPYYNY